MSELVAPTTTAAKPSPTAAPSTGRAPTTNGRRPPDGGDTLGRFVAAQVVDTQRMAAAFRAFRRDEFGSGPSSPSWPHIEAANELLERERQQLERTVAAMVDVGKNGAPAGEQLPKLLAQKTQAMRDAKLVEKIWDFYFEIFNQRQSRFADLLRATDRIALDCYQTVYTGLDTPRTIPSPPPFSYMETGATPATFRRNVRLSRLGQRMNPFPIVDLPYHRLINPWTLGAVHHEVAHNLQSDLELWEEVPRRLHGRLLQAGLVGPVARTWARWHKETWADLCGLLLGGPAIVASLIGVLAQAPRVVLSYNPDGVHPTPYLRTFISIELLRRMGFEEEAEQFHRLWQRLYPSPGRGNLPQPLLASFPRASRLVVDTICYQPYPQLGGKSLAEVVQFKPTHQEMTREAAERVAGGADPGIIPARFLVGAARWALDNKLASPRVIANNFYKALMKR